MLVFAQSGKRLCKKPSLGMGYMRKTLAGLAILLGSCFRRNDGCWFLHSLERDCAKNLVRLRWWKTQPPKSPLSGGLVTQFPPDKGG